MNGLSKNKYISMNTHSYIYIYIHIHIYMYIYIYVIHRHGQQHCVNQRERWWGEVEEGKEGINGKGKEFYFG